MIIWTQLQSLLTDFRNLQKLMWTWLNVWHKQQQQQQQQQQKNNVNEVFKTQKQHCLRNGQLWCKEHVTSTASAKTWKTPEMIL